MSDGCTDAQGFEASAAKPLSQGWWVALVVALIGLVYWLTRKPRPKVFISFASEDMGARDLLVRQSHFERTWKREVRPMIEECDVLLLLIGPDTWRAQGAIWEVERARASRIPIIGMHITPQGRKRGRVPVCMAGEKIINWKFDDLKEALAAFG